MDSAQALILNETAVAQMQLTDPIGTRIDFNRRERVVIGVIKDFNYSSLHSSIEPLGVVMPFTVQETILVRTNGRNIPQILTSLEADWRDVFESKAPFDVSFLDDDIQAMYEKELVLSKLVGIFSSLAVILACLGLYGLVAFSVRARLKEVGIRKVLGASLRGMLMLLSKQFFQLILVANLIALPLIYFLGERWLNEFSYRMNMEVAVFLVPALLLTLMALITVAHQVVRAAFTNPVEVLRNE